MKAFRTTFEISKENRDFISTYPRLFVFISLVKFRDNYCNWLFYQLKTHKQRSPNILDMIVGLVNFIHIYW